MKFPRLFFTQEYRKYDESQLEFRKHMLKIIVIISSLVCIVFMIISFPTRRFSVAIYISTPAFVVITNVTRIILLRKRFEKHNPLLLLFLQLCGVIISIELTLGNVENGNTYQIYFNGLYAGITQIISFLNFSSSIHKMIISIMLFIYVMVKDILINRENTHIRAATLFCSLLFINYVFFKTEILFFQMWRSISKRNESLQNFQKLIENFPSQIIILNKDCIDNNRPLYCNKEAELSLEGLESHHDSVLGFLDCFKLVGESDSYLKVMGAKTNSLRDKVLDILNSGDENMEYSTFNCDKGNENKWGIKLGWIEWCQNDALIIIFNDISKSERIKELQLLNTNKNKLLATVSHELRTPINGTLGMIENAQSLLTETQIDIKYCLDIAKSSVRTLLLMVNDILDMEQIRHGKLRLHIESVNLHGLIQKVLPLIEVQIKNKNLELIYDNDCPVETRVFVDSSRLQQILWNLLWNACKFTSTGYVMLKARLIRSRVTEINLDYSKNSLRESSECEILLNSTVQAADDYLRVELSIEDTGMGMEPNTLENLFQDFGKKENACNPTGVGLGLAISQSLAKQMNSAGISVESEYGRGSKFCFSVNAELSENNKRPPHEFPALGLSQLKSDLNDDTERTKEQSSKAFKILVVDDDLVNHCVFDLYLKSLSNECSKDKAFNGKEALKLITEKANTSIYFDLILMDCQMPVMDGFKTTVAIKELIESGKIPNVNIIALTANHSPADREHCLSLGMKDVWTKPISREDFINKIKKEKSKKLY